MFDPEDDIFPESVFPSEVFPPEVFSPEVFPRKLKEEDGDSNETR
jgi:hypothetical protein